MLHHRMRRAASALIAPGDGGSSSAMFNSSAEVAEPGATTLTVPMPTNSDGDLLFVWLFTRSSTFASPITPPSGWTAVDTHTYRTCGLYVKTASSEPASYVWTVNTSVRMVAIAVSVSGVTGYTSATITNSNTTNSVTMPSDGMVLAFYGDEDEDVTPSTPSGMTIFPTGTIYSGNAVFSVGYYAPASAGTVGGKTNSGLDSSGTDSVLIGVY